MLFRSVIGRLRVREWSTEEKSGVAVEVDATAVGHDLSRGTAVFTRYRKEQMDDEEVSAIEPWANESAERLADMATAAGISVSSLDGELMDVAPSVERKSA